MTTPSSTGSWSGARGNDVIDLDRFMRGVRPHRVPSRTRRTELVVDGGGVRAAASSSSSGASSVHPAHAHKRFSHDSGVSDGSFVKRRSRPHRRHSVAESGNIKTKREVARGSGSGESMRAFRKACERALCDQQRQLARVALLCERLSERRGRSDTERTGTDTSELSSSSRSTRDPRRREKSRAQECKTYKIIMTKLDELNRRLVARPPPRSAPSAAAPSVEVSDKVVATEPAVPAVVAPRQMQKSPRLASLRAVTRACALDIAPHEAVCQYRNITTESVVKRGSSVDGSHTTAGDPRFGFDLDDPVQLYAQAKRLQAMHVSSRRTRSSAPTDTGRSAGAGRAGGGGGGGSLCALCREYWRALREFLVAQVCCPRDDLPCACS